MEDELNKRLATTQIFTIVRGLSCDGHAIYFINILVKPPIDNGCKNIPVQIFVSFFVVRVCLREQNKLPIF